MDLHRPKRDKRQSNLANLLAAARSRPGARHSHQPQGTGHPIGGAASRTCRQPVQDSKFLPLQRMQTPGRWTLDSCLVSDVPICVNVVRDCTCIQGTVFAEHRLIASFTVAFHERPIPCRKGHGLGLGPGTRNKTKNSKDGMGFPTNTTTYSMQCNTGLASSPDPSFQHHSLPQK